MELKYTLLNCMNILCRYKGEGTQSPYRSLLYSTAKRLPNIVDRVSCVAVTIHDNNNNNNNTYL